MEIVISFKDYTERSLFEEFKYNRIFQIVQILVEEKVQNLSATARKALLTILNAIVLRSAVEDVHVTTARELVQQFSEALEGHVCGSPSIISAHKIAAGKFQRRINFVKTVKLFDKLSKKERKKTSFISAER